MHQKDFIILEQWIVTYLLAMKSRILVTITINIEDKIIKIGIDPR